jgi:hypothetical protein
MGSVVGLAEVAAPPMTNLSSLSVATSSPVSTAEAAPQSQGSPLLGQICRVIIRRV